MNFIDNFLNRITMYRLVLYILVAWTVTAIVLGALGKLALAPLSLLYSVLVLLLVSHFSNKIFARIFGVPANAESTYITAFILALVVSPPSSGQYLTVLPLLFWIGVLGVAVKYILVVRKKHIFNPVAISLVIVSFAIQESASWWIGTAWMLPFVAIGGLLIVRKIRRFELVASFIVVALATIVAGSLNNLNVPLLLRQVFVDSPIIFFALVMLTEPLTTPPSRLGRIIYGSLTGIFYAPFMHIGSIYSTPELALCLSNIVSWILSPKSKYVLTLKSKKKIARDTGEFVFVPDRPIRFKPGQYLEWTLAHKHPDSRGNRRFFTIASSPTEENIILGVKFDAKRSSSFKKALAEMEEGQTLLAGGLAGDFVLPKDKKEKLCFVAGGIGITPFRSMVAYMLDKEEKRDVVLIYSCKRYDEIAYTNLMHHAFSQYGLKTACTLSDIDHIPEDWQGYRGFVSVEMFLQEVPEYLSRTFYISGPKAFIDSTKKILAELGVDENRIKTDYFPGF